jgi:hypothetical protein
MKMNLNRKVTVTSLVVHCGDWSGNVSFPGGCSASQECIEGHR